MCISACQSKYVEEVSGGCVPVVATCKSQARKGREAEYVSIPFTLGIEGLSVIQQNKCSNKTNIK